MTSNRLCVNKFATIDTYIEGTLSKYPSQDLFLPLAVFEERGPEGEDQKAQNALHIGRCYNGPIAKAARHSQTFIALLASCQDPQETSCTTLP